MTNKSTAPLVELLDKAEVDADVRELLESGESAYGRVLHTWQALAHRPEIFLAYMPYLRAIVGPGALEQRLKELVEVRVAVLNRCHYSVAHRVRSARASGVANADLVAVARGELDSFASSERLALEAAEVLTLAPPITAAADAPQVVSDDMLTALKATFTDAQLVELMVTIGLWNALARFHRVMGFELDMAAPPSEITTVL
jgi:AhpD family alkylhydroperoxidase